MKIYSNRDCCLYDIDTYQHRNICMTNKYNANNGECMLESSNHNKLINIEHNHKFNQIVCSVYLYPIV